MEADEHFRRLNALIQEDHEDLIAQLRADAQAAAARGDTWYEKWYLDRVDRLEAIPKPWESPAA